MRKTILFSLACLIVVAMAACGGGDNAGNKGGNAVGGGDTAGDKGGSSDPYALYKKEGRTWKHKSVTKMEGMDDMVSFMSYEVKSVADDHAVYVMTMLDAEGKPNEHVPPSETKIDFVTHDAPACTGAEPVETKEETIKVEAGEFECIVTEVSGTKSWSSKKYPGLLVKMEGASNSMELVEFKE